MAPDQGDALAGRDPVDHELFADHTRGRGDAEPGATPTPPPTRRRPRRMAALPAAPLAAAETTSTPVGRRRAGQAGARPRPPRQDQRRHRDARKPSPIRSPASWSNGAILRSDENDAGFDRLAAFSAENPSWPNAIDDPQPRRERAVGRDARPARSVRAFFGATKPMTAKGKFALARALLAQGDDAGRGATRRARPGATTPARATSSAP